MKNWIFIITSFLAITSYAQVEEVEIFDLNKDGISDRFEYSLKNKVVRIDEDRNADGKVDFKTVLDDKRYYKIEWQDADYNSKFERKKSYQVFADEKIRVMTEVDQNSDGIFEIMYETILDNNQKQNSDCEMVVSGRIQELSNIVLKVVSKNEKGLLPTGVGFKVDGECYNRWGNDFNKILKEVALESLQCLVDLDKKGKTNKNTTGAIRNAFGLTQIMKNDGISLVCSETNEYDWSAATAHASTVNGQILKSMNITHPFISLNPALPENVLGNQKKEIAKLKSTIFHESLHNLGFLHEDNLEFSYTCGLCCFDKESDAKVQEKACKVCTGNYKNETDLDYIKDFVEFSQLNYQKQRGAAAVVKFMKENPKSLTGVSILAYSESGVFNPIGPELSELIKAQNKDFTAEENKYLSDAEKYNSNIISEFKIVDKTSKILASSLYELYYNKNGVNALNGIENNKAVIKEELEKLKNTGGNSKYIHEEISRVLDRMITDMWINKYPSGKDADPSTSDQLYKLFEYFRGNNLSP